MIEQISLQLIKLNDSQVEIALALQDNPSDPDFQDALLENNEIICRKRGKIEELHEFLEKIDPAYREERNTLRNITNRVGESIPSVNTNPSDPSLNTTIIIPIQNTNNESSQYPQNEENGIYL